LVDTQVPDSTGRALSLRGGQKRPARLPDEPLENSVRTEEPRGLPCHALVAMAGSPALRRASDAAV